MEATLVAHLPRFRVNSLVRTLSNACCCGTFIGSLRGRRRSASLESMTVSAGGFWVTMATFEKPKTSRDVPLDLLPVIRESGVLSDRQFSDLRAKVLRGDYPTDSVALAERLVEEKVLTTYQSERFLANKSHGLKVGRYSLQDRFGSGSMGVDPGVANAFGRVGDGCLGRLCCL